MIQRKLVLEDGSEFYGFGFGANVDNIGEVVFTTQMVGYQEVLSNPSACQQIMCFTYPLIGNVGINPYDFQDLSTSIVGLVVEDYTDCPSHWQVQETLATYLEKQGIPAIFGVDTRALVKRIRKHGSMYGSICDAAVSTEDMVHLLKEKQGGKQRLVDQVATKQSYMLPGKKERIVIVDFGVKKSILKELNARLCDTIVVSYQTSLNDIEILRPDGIILSNGPGHPEDMVELLPLIRTLAEKYPIFGIGLGHQLLALSQGAKITKLAFGHHGANQAVKDLRNGRVYSTTQHHQFIVDERSVQKLPITITHKNLNDQSIEGLAYQQFKGISIQFYPDASPQDDEKSYWFAQFLELITMAQGVEK